MAQLAIEKPMLRGHFHQAAFFMALGACGVLLGQSRDLLGLVALSIYSLSLCGLFGISALYHRPNWQPEARARMRRLDHAGIFILIGGTATPICLLGVGGDVGIKMLMILWAAIAVGVVQSLVWVSAPKWLSVGLYLVVGWISVPYLPMMKTTLGSVNVGLILVGGLIYSVGGLIYGLKRPVLWPKVFSYHELFHVLVILAAMAHFVVIQRLIG